MQQSNTTKTNKSRTEHTKAALKTAARKLILEKGYAETGTPEIVRYAKVTRGALYHHYADKKALFEEVIEDECAAVAMQINESSMDALSAIDALKQGSDAFISAMAGNGRTKLILIEAPTVLGREKLLEIEDRHTRQSLKVGVSEAMEAGFLVALPLDALIEILSSIFDSAALNIEAGMPRDDITCVVHGIIDGLMIEPK